LTEITGETDHIRQYPDFTNLIQGIVPQSFDPDKHGVCLVPNYRMIDRTSDEVAASYIPFMIRCEEKLQSEYVKPFILVHEGKDDLWLAEQISAAVGGVPILVESNPIKIKGILGASYATIGSRFHGLVSALSQGVPSLATGWSHKYQELMNDYGYPDGMVALASTDEELHKTIELLVDKSANAEHAARLQKQSTKLKALSEDMWVDVLKVIDENFKKGSRGPHAN
jgi:colanic acid/amylovoran biosynthesis protein